MQIINKISSIFLASVLLFSCNNASKQKNDADSSASVETFKIKGGWAYSIFIGKKEFIRQQNIPCIQGEIPFETEKQALKAGVLVLNKLKDRKVPSLNLKELEENHLLPSKDANNNNSQNQSSTH